MCMINARDEVGDFFSVFGLGYAEIIKLGRWDPGMIEGNLENNFKLQAPNLKQQLHSRTKAVIYSLLANPTGSFLAS